MATLERRQRRRPRIPLEARTTLKRMPAPLPDEAAGATLGGPQLEYEKGVSLGS